MNVMEPLFMPETLLMTVAYLLLFVHAVHITYQFQIKEYRFDRIWVEVSEHKTQLIWSIFAPRLPAIKKPRNVALLGFSSTLIALLSMFIPVSYGWGIGLLMSGPILAFLMITLGVCITNFPVKWHRARLVNRAKKLLEHSHTTFIGISGSYGKSTIKEYLFHILSQRYQVARTERNHNTDVGIALSLMKYLTPNTQYFVAEMGAYRIGEIAVITNLVHPLIGVISALGNQHVALFGSRERILQAKSELAVSLPPDGALFIASNLTRIQKAFLKKNTRAHVFEFEAVPQDPHQTALNAAVAVAQYTGMNTEEIATALEKIQRPHHLRVRPHHKGYSFLNSSYSSSVEAFLSHIHILKSVHKSKKIVFTSGVQELGREKMESYLKIIASMPPHTVIYTTDATFKKAVHESLSGRIEVFWNRNQFALLNRLERDLTHDAVVLIEGRFREEVVERIIS